MAPTTASTSLEEKISAARSVLVRSARAGLPGALGEGMPAYPLKDMRTFGTGAHGVLAASTKTQSPPDEGKTSAGAGTATRTASSKEADFIWSDEGEPHALRKRAILKKYGKRITSLMGPSWKTKYVVMLTVTLHCAMAYLLRDKAWTTWEFWVGTYLIGGTLTQNCFLAIHEITHGLAFKSVKANRLLAMVANLPIAIPYSAKFPGYHMEHHRYQGTDGIDTDIPHPLEAWLFHQGGMLAKIFFAFNQILFYAIRPSVVRDQAVDAWFVLNFAVQIAFDVAVVKAFGMGPIWYFLLSAFFAGSIHPIASHFIAEHYVFLGDQETYSYYGWLNCLTFNVGYHNEHHDFPNIAWDKLPQVREIAHDFYDNLPYHRSWPEVLYQFITTPSVSSFNRVKRPDVKNLATTTVVGQKNKSR